jgi:hypothetical protein
MPVHLTRDVQAMPLQTPLVSLCGVTVTDKNEAANAFTSCPKCREIARKNQRIFVFQEEACHDTP